MRGAAAIPQVRENIIRPLLSCTRAEIEKYCEAHGLVFVTDSTNLSDDYTRNKIRHHVIPVLREVNPHLEGALLRFSRDAAEVSAYMERQAEKALVAAKTAYGYSAEMLLQNDIAVLKTAIIVIVKKYNCLPNHSHLDLLIKILRHGGAVELDKSHTLVCDRGVLRMKQETEESREIILRKPGCISFNGSVYAVTANDSLFENKSLIFRSRRDGDAFCFLKRKITKSLGKALREINLPSEQRDRVPCLCEDSTVLWCEPLGWSKQGKKYQQTQHLFIEKRQ